MFVGFGGRPPLLLQGSGDPRQDCLAAWFPDESIIRKIAPRPKENGCKAVFCLAAKCAIVQASVFLLLMGLVMDP